MPTPVNSDINTHMEHIKKHITAAIALLAILILTACNNKDDIEEIFTEKTWKLAFIQDGAERIVREKEYTLKFNKASFTFTDPQKATISGSWSADGGTRQFICNNITTSGNIQGDQVTQKAREILQKAKAYIGDAKSLQIIEEPGNKYMQFY